MNNEMDKQIGLVLKNVPVKIKNLLDGKTFTVDEIGMSGNQ